MRRSAAFLLLGIMSLLAGKTDAGTITYDSPLAGPGYYNGTGPSQNGFTVDNENGIELGLRAEIRNVGGIDTPTNSYTVTGGVVSGHATWNYDFSINLLSTGLQLKDITALLTITDLSAAGQPSATVSLYGPYGSVFGDNYGYDGTSTHSNAVGTDIGAQNSENPIFGGFALNSISPGYFSAHAFDTYEFTLAVSKTGDSTGPSASESINVVAVGTPLPASVWQGGVLLGGLGLLAAKRRRAIPAI